MKLIGSLTSPYTRNVRFVLAEKKIEVEFVLESPHTPDSIIPGLNPLGKIPVLVLDDDSALFDSRVIVEYLDSMTPNNKLLPAPSRERIEVRRWEATADGMCDAAVLAVMESKRPAKERSSAWITRQMEKVNRSVDFMAAELGESSWCMGTHFSLADITVACALGYLDFRFPELDWRARHVNLARFYLKAMTRSGFSETVPHD